MNDRAVPREAKGVGRRGFLHVQKSEAQTYTTTLLNQARMSVATPGGDAFAKGTRR
jgi:hypothetical protein